MHKMGKRNCLFEKYNQITKTPKKYDDNYSKHDKRELENQKNVMQIVVNMIITIKISLK